MMEDLPNDLLGNQLFQEFVTNMVEKMQIQVSNDLKLRELTIDDDVVKAIWVSLIQNRTAFELMKNFNLILNGADENAFGNINKFIGQIEMLYIDGEARKEEVLKRGY